MSTRANIVLKETYSYKDADGKVVTKSEELIFYRHSDGYPDGTLPTLEIFMNWLKTGKIRNNLSQAAGWLVVLGAIEYGSIPKHKTEKPWESSEQEYAILDSIEEPRDWKCGAYEPTTCIHGDIEYLYEIDLTNKTLTVNEV